MQYFVIWREKTSSSFARRKSIYKPEVELRVIFFRQITTSRVRMLESSVAKRIFIGTHHMQNFVTGIFFYFE